MRKGSDSHMIILKANVEIKTVFLKMLKTMGEEINWIEIFVINNNDIILAGKVRSLFFNFESRRASSTIVELPINRDKIEEIPQDILLKNALNMMVYAFGKWGAIKGIKVDMDYDELNRLLNNILDEIDIESRLTRNNFRFYKDGVQITYEEVIQIILNKLKPKGEEGGETEPEEIDDLNEEKDAEKIQKDETNEFKIGLWHNVNWISGNFSFEKAELTESDKLKLRLGNNFYVVNYKCPECNEKLQMVVYPVGKEFRIETDKEAVYMSRAYTCNTCLGFYTPWPEKLLIEGDVFYLTFEDDRKAYEDYFELLGSQGERTSNFNFNEFESQYHKKIQKNPLKLEGVFRNITSMTEDEIVELKEKMDSGFYPEESVEKYYKKVDKELKRKKYKNSKKKENKSSSDGPANTLEKKHESEDAKKKRTQHAQKSNKDELKKDYSIEAEQRERAENEHLKIQVVEAIIKGDDDIFLRAAEKLSTKQLGDLKPQIQSEQSIDEKKKKDYIDKIDRVRSMKKEKELIEKVAQAKVKQYAEILPVIEEIKREDCSEDVKKSILRSIMELLKKRGEKELEEIISHIPEKISRKQYNQFKEKIEQYKEMDISPYKKRLDESLDALEKQEITAIVKRANTADRKSLFDTYEKLKEKNFEERNAKPFLEKIYDKIYIIDEDTIKKICPEPADITFDEGLEMYEKISSGDFLPELKENVLEMLDKRLKKIKMDECEQLVIKLCKDIKSIIEDGSRVYFYEVRKMVKEDPDDAESIIIHNALNTYAVGRGKYEYPILICDTSQFSNGAAGFVLTPDQIFYRSLINIDVINVMDIENIFVGNGLFGKGIYINKKNTGKVKISNSLKSNNLESFAKVLDGFISYLKEKPESRKVSYLTKEKHTVKCCYRCGYVYKGGNVCPKCGGKFNE